MAGTLKPMPTRRPRTPAARIPAVPPEALVPKPWSLDDIARLHVLATHLGGRPVPGLRMTAAQFIAWQDAAVTAEWVGGEVVLVAPVARDRGSFADWFTRLLGAYVEATDAGTIAGPEVLVRLPNQRRIRAPDLQFIAKGRADIFRRTVVHGAPDAVFEIVTADSIACDIREKHFEYERAGVREYWVVSPIHPFVQANRLGHGGRYTVVRESDGKLASTVLRGFYFRPKWLRASRLPTVTSVLRELGVR